MNAYEDTEERVLTKTEYFESCQHGCSEYESADGRWHYTTCGCDQCVDEFTLGIIADEYDMLTADGYVPLASGPWRAPWA